MGFGLVLAAIGLVLLVWPRPIVAYVKLTSGGFTGLSLNAPARRPPSTHRVELVARWIGGCLLLGGVSLALALS